MNKTIKRYISGIAISAQYWRCIVEYTDGSRETVIERMPVKGAKQ